MADSSSNPYIRTYAKDMAAMGAQPDAAPAAALKKTGGDREAVLARLRARAANEPVHENTVLPSSMPLPVPHAEPTDEPLAPVASPPPPPEPVRAEPVVVPASPAPEPLPSIPQLTPKPPVAPPTPVPAPVAPTPAASPDPSPLHTYTSDFADRIDTKSASAFSVLAAQSDAGQAVPTAVPEKKSRKGLWFALGSAFLIVFGAGGLYAAYWYVSTHQNVPLAPSVPSLVFADDRQPVHGEGQELLAAVASSAATALPDGQVRVLYLTESTTTPDGKQATVPLPGGRLIGSLQLSAPDILMRNIAPESTLGIVHAGSESRAFFILRVLSYERTFAGMLQWEATMPNSLSALYPAYELPAPVDTIATTTKVVNGKRVTATTTIPAPELPAPHFIDEVASNHDVRAYKDGTGKTILLYGYVDKSTLVIARDEAAFAELINRLSATKQQ